MGGASSRTPEGEWAALAAVIADCGGDRTLLDGWRVAIEERKLGNSAGQMDAYWYAPSGKKFRSRGEVARHLGLDAPPKKAKRSKQAARWDHSADGGSNAPDGVHAGWAPPAAYRHAS